MRLRTLLLVLMLFSVLLFEGFVTIQLVKADVSDFSYYQSFEVSQASGAGTNYPVSLDVYRGSGSSSGNNIYLDNNNQSTFPNDINFTASDQSTWLDHWVEESNSSYAKIWVEISADLSADDETAYIYYGKSGASGWSNGTNTFTYFDHFSGNSLGADWNTQGTPSVSSSEVNLNGDDAIYSSTNFSVGYSVRARSKADEQDIEFVGFKSDFDTIGGSKNFTCILSSDYGGHDGNYDEMRCETGSADGGATITYVDDQLDFRDTYYTYETTRVSGSVKFYQDDNLLTTHTIDVPQGDLGVGWRVWDSSENSTLTVDWVLVRKYVDPEPTISYCDVTTPIYRYADSNSTSISVNGTLELYAQGQDEIGGSGLDFGWLWTNETGGSGKNYTYYIKELYSHDWNLDYIRNVWVEDDILYVVEYTDVCVFNVSDKSSPTSLANLTLTTGSGTMGLIDVMGDGEGYLYIADNPNDSLHIVNVTDPSNPSNVTKLTDTTSLAGNHGLFYLDDYVYNCAYDSGNTGKFTIVNVTDVSSPSQVGYLRDDDKLKGCHDVYVRDNIAYVGCHRSATANNGHFTIVNVTDVSNPTIISDIDSALMYGGSDVQLKGDYAFFNGHNNTSHERWIHSIDISDVNNPSIANSLAGPNLYVADIKNNTLYAVTSTYEENPPYVRLNIIDISDPTNLSRVSYIDYTGHATMHVLEEDGYLYVTLRRDETNKDNGTIYIYEAMPDGRFPVDMDDAVGTWRWSNFTWQNTSIAESATIQWRIYYNDTAGNTNATAIQTFYVGPQAPILNQLRLSTTSSDSNITSISVNVEYHFEANITDNNNLDDLENVTMRFENNPANTILEDTPTFTENSEYWCRLVISNTTWQWYDGSAWSTSTTYLNTTGSVYPSLSGTQGWFKFRLKTSKIATHSASWEFAALVHDSDDNDTATFSSITIAFYSEISIATETHSWVSIAPGDSNKLIDEGTIDFTVISNANYDIQIKSLNSSLSSDENSFGIGNVSYSTGTWIIGDYWRIDADDWTLLDESTLTSLTTSYATVSQLSNVAAGQDTHHIKLWVSVPNGTASGDYSYTLTLKVAEHA